MRFRAVVAIGDGSFRDSSNYRGQRMDFRGLAEREPREQQLERVSYHAVTRYVQRILRVTVDVPSTELPLLLYEANRMLAERHCAAAGTTVAAIREKIMTPALMVAALAGFPEARLKGFVALMQHGVVTTITERKGDRNRPARLPTLTEARRYEARMAKRQRRRPSSRDYE